MSTLNRILIVILVVLAITHSAVLLTYLSQQQSWKTLALEKSETVDTLLAELKSEGIANTQTRDQLRKEKKALQDQLRDAKSRLERANTDLTNARFKLGQLTSANERFSQRLANFDASLTRAQQARDHANDQLDRARNTSSELKAENARLERQVADLLRDVMVLDAEVRRKKEQIAALQEDIRKASDRTTVRAPVAVSVRPAPLLARRPINGKVVAVNLDAKIATVNVGSIAGVSEGTKFTIYDDDYVGNLNITRVFRDESLGTILMSARPVEVGDEVSTSPLK
ncbi:MAG: hypothetical protein KAT11_03035 [Phycisphaerae bacterium]|nr:hypothetical protein [Phycisphaerae bacterium]